MENEEENENSFQISKIFGDVEKRSAAKQFLMGTLSGYGTGFIAMKIGKITAFAVGGGIIILQIANHNGYVQINWEKINKNISEVTEKVEEVVKRQTPGIKEKIYEFISSNTYVSTGYIAGLLIAIAHS